MTEQSKKEIELTEKIARLIYWYWQLSAKSEIDCDEMDEPIPKTELGRRAYALADQIIALHRKEIEEREDQFQRYLRIILKGKHSKLESKVLAVLQTALKQSLAGEEIDLPEDLYGLFCAIQNSGIAKIKADVLEIIRRNSSDVLAGRESPTGVIIQIEAYFTEKK